MDIGRREVYRRMGYALSEPLDVRRRGRRPGETGAFDYICDHIKFGKCAKLLEAKNQAMKDAGIKISHFEFRPHNGSEFYYNFIIKFGVSASHYHGGNQRRR